MYNLQSKEIVVAPNTMWRIHGAADRRVIALSLGGNEKLDVALCPLGTVDPTEYWLDGVGDQSKREWTLHHFGEIYLRDTNNSQNLIIRIVSDKQIVATMI